MQARSLPGWSRFSLLTLVLLLITLASAAPLAAQDWKGRGRLQGIVTDMDGNPIKGAQVTLRSVEEPDAGPAPITTNKHGRWSYLGLVGGKWKVEIEAPDYHGSEGEIDVSEISTNDTVRVSLRPITEQEKAAAAEDAAMGLIDKGNTLLEEKKFGEARAQFEQALGKLEPQQQVPVLRGIAHTYTEQGKTDEAIDTLKKALAIQPDDVDSLRVISTLLVSEGHEEEAGEYMARLPEGQKVDPTAALNVGIDLYNKKDLDGALAKFNRVVEENPSLPDGYYYRGLVFLNQGKNAEAIADFKKLLELAPDYSQATEVKQFLDYLESQKKK